MRQQNAITDLVVWSFLVGAILVLTRPGSQGPKFISNLTGGYANIVKASTGQQTS